MQEPHATFLGAILWLIMKLGIFSIPFVLIVLAVAFISSPFLTKGKQNEDTDETNNNDRA